MNSLFRSALGLASGFWLAAGGATVDFGRTIQPLLAEHCFHCHGKDEATRKGGLRLDERDAALKGGKSDGPAIAPGQPDKSSLIARIESHDVDELMPPPKDKKPLSSSDKQTLRQWIVEGAPYAGHWAFERPAKAPLPESGSTGHPVDAFVVDRLAREGMVLSPPASPETICRRLHLDLIGLPPTPAALDAFAKSVEASGLNAAAAGLADALMKDRRFGEKWARHWLDVGRYSDSNGFEKDLPREQWAWRDWVIRALNTDMPYDRFVIEQIAGDLLPDPTQDQIVATGFLRNSMINEEGAIIPEEWRLEAMFDRMDAVGSGMLGLSLKCGQCHSHKFDPLSHTEYYGLLSHLDNTYEAQSWLFTADQRQAVAKMHENITAVEKRLKEKHADWERRLADWERAELEAANRAAWTVVNAEDTHSSSELNHPTVLADGSILTLGHRTVSGDVHFIAEPAMENLTGLRLEILTHGDLPYGGPGRSFRGTWTMTELEVDIRRPGSNNWERVKLVDATTDFEEIQAGMEPEWANRSTDPDNHRLRGPVAYMIDGDGRTAWRADRGRGRRNTDSVAVARFEKPLTFPSGTKLKVALVTSHGGDDNGAKNTQVGRFRVALTSSAEPKASRIPYAAVLAMQIPAAQRTDEQRRAIFAAWRKTVAEFKSFNDEIEKLWEAYPEPVNSVLTLAERKPEHARETRRLDRGVWSQPREVVRPHVPAALHAMASGGLPPRLAFARWLVDPRSPLTARVAVNRLWQTLFGVGIVETAEDFGTRAPEPSHRELLDWLAVDFMEQGWSQKRLLRLLVTSTTYLQSSRATPALLEKDPKNRLLARGPRFRVEAEVVRDIALATSGLLSDKFGGPSIFPPVPQSVLDFNYSRPHYWKPAEDATRYSRALYMFRKRSMPDPSMLVFDAPTGDTACTRRPRSNSPLAALTAMNETIFVEAAQALALRVLRESGPGDAERVDHAFRLCTSRLPTDSERNELLALLGGRRERLRRGELKASDIAFSAFTRPSEIPSDATPNDVAAWAIASRVLLNLDETIAKN